MKVTPSLSTRSPSPSQAVGYILIPFGAIFAFVPFLIIFGSGEDELTLETILASALFGSIGIGVMIFGLYSVYQGRKRRRLVAEAPEKPWLHRKDWREGKVRDGNLQTAIGLSVFSALWLGMVSLMTVVALSDGEIGIVLFISLFLIIGLVMAGCAVRSILKVRKFGTSEFALADNPGVIGGALGGVIYTKVNLPAREGFHLKLENINKVTTRRGKNSTTTETVIWSESDFIEEEALPDNHQLSAIPVYFEIPYHCSEANYDRPNNQFIWRLSVSAKLPGIDYKAAFEVPVFKTGDSRSNFGARTPDQVKRGETPTVEALEPGSESFASTISKAGLRLESDGAHDLAIAWYGSDHKKLFLPGVFVSIVPALIGFTIFFSGAPVPFMLMGIFMAFAIAAFCINALNTRRRLTVENGILSYTEQSIGRKKCQRFEAREISQIMSKPGWIINGRQHYTLVLLDQHKQTHKLFPNIADPSALSMLNRALEQRLGLPGEH